MLALTERAAEVIKGIVDESDAGPGGGLRITGTAEADGEAALEFSVAPEPVEGDAVVEDGGATVFLDELAAEVLSGKKLDVEAHDDHYHFSLGDQDEGRGLRQDVPRRVEHDPAEQGHAARGRGRREAEVALLQQEEDAGHAREHPGGEDQPERQVLRDRRTHQG